ncbi:winged helix-turn-helix domain-containing protein [Miniphocaeibacter massiliensis]|uniref:winged helix-turn-helix domain-containing protein n=1 Tax=Miniphocaeibacter massiliensis TaxID=2041841 RepID=UPI000C1BE1C6|nr:LysR family transcriptional regulator [Miniphocaeibacter massiliensis]
MKLKGVNRIIIENLEGDKVFGKGPYTLLLKVRELGSLNKAAQEMGMSYSKAFNVIKKCEKAFKKQFMEREIGGAKGGGSTLTEDGLNLIKNYEHIVEEMDKKLEELLEEIDF